jgi:tRNA A58 N-methylase Trm61
VIRAVEKFKARRGVGVDLDPQRIQESRANARTAKVEDRVEFRQGDVFDVKDLADATVVTLYMGDELNLQLRPVLRKTLKPGTRIVSHRFTMGDWKPLTTKQIIGYDGDQYLIHLWKITKEDAGKK